MTNDIICISDLHLCDKGYRDNFYARGEKRLLKFLDFVDDSGCELFILGDLFEWWQCNLSSSLLQYKELIKRLDCVGPMGKGACWIAGNHDNLLTGFLPNYTGFKLGGIELPYLRKEFIAPINERKFLFCHGHESDATCRSLNPGVGYITAIISGMMEDRNKGPNDGVAIEDSFISTLERALNTWRWLTRKHNRRKELIDSVEAYRQKKNADVVIYGHTHEPGQLGNYHFNCGCWCREQDTFVRIRTDGTANTFIWDGEKPVSFEKELL